MATLTQQARAMSTALMPIVNTVLLARAHHGVMAERVDKIQRALIADEKPTTEDGEPITEPRLLYLMEESQWAGFYAKLDQRIRAAGFNVQPGYCPALMAEELVRKAEHAMVDQAAEYIPELTHENLMRNFSKYKEALSLIIGLVVNAPGYTAPTP